MTPRAYTKNTSSIGDNETTLIIELFTPTTKSEKGIESSKLPQIVIYYLKMIYPSWSVLA